MRLHFHTILITACILLFSCKENTKEEITKIVSEWQGKEVVFPEDMVFTHYGKDTIHDYTIPESEYKILLYVDSVGCTSCKLQLHKWGEFIAEVDSLTNRNVSVLFFFHPKDKRELNYLLKRDGIEVPVCLDGNDRLNSINRFRSVTTSNVFVGQVQ